MISDNDISQLFVAGLLKTLGGNVNYINAILESSKRGSIVFSTSPANTVDIKLEFYENSAIGVTMLILSSEILRDGTLYVATSKIGVGKCSRCKIIDVVLSKIREDNFTQFVEIFR